MKTTNFTKKDLINEVHKKHFSFTKAQVAATVDAVFDTIEEALCDKDRCQVSISKFGKFERLSVGKRAYRNPHTGEEVVVPAHSKVKFKPFKPLKDAVKNA